MDIKINSIPQINQVNTEKIARNVGEEFKFTLIKRLDDTNLVEKLLPMLAEIEKQGKKIKKHMDLRDFKHYRVLIKEFLNEILTRSHEFMRENYLDRRGRHRVYGIVRIIDKNLDELAKDLIQDEKEPISILSKIDEIRGLLLDIFT